MILLTHVTLWLTLFSGVFGISEEVTVGDLGEVIGNLQYTEWNNRSVYTFRGIPYAEPPVGDLRFQPPVKITTWNGTLNATSYGPACPQSTGISYSEDCLTLNVFVPAIKNYDNETLLPVLIFIHGGTFRYGYASAYVPLRFMDEEDLIVVVPQFRLGLLGLYSLQTDDVPGNVQFLDQIMAMQWVQENIEYFGGDKNRVTLYGHSSGSASVHFHLLSPLTEGLFHQTILQSGSALRTYGVDKNPIESAIILADYCGCKNTTLTEEIANCMRSLTVEEIVNCSSNYLSETIYDGLTRARGQMAVVQHAGEFKFLIEEPKVLLERGEFLKLPMMGGVTKNDGSSHFKDIYDQILNPYGLFNDTDYALHNLTGYVLKYLGESDITNSIEYSMIRTYFTKEQLGDSLAMTPGLIDICSSISYKSGSHKTLAANRVFEKTYLYTFDYKVYDPNSESPLYPFDDGVTHGDDLWLLMPRYDYQKENDVEMAKVMIKLWTSFIINEVPTADGVTWPVMSSSVGPYIVIDGETSVRSDFFDEYITNGVTSSIIKISLINIIWLQLILIINFISGSS